MSKKLFSLAICLFLVFGNAALIYAETSIPACKEDKVVIAFFNGVQTSKPEAKIIRYYLKKFYGNKTASGIKIEYDILYNSSVGFGDFMETFEQKAQGELAELAKILLERYDLYNDLIKDDGPWYEKLKAIPRFAQFAKACMDFYNQKTAEDLLKSADHSSTLQEYQEHTTKIYGWLAEDKNMLFVAHSQGNLFANAAYAYLKSINKEDFARIVHVAPPTNKLDGRKHILADLDWVIRPLPNTPDVTDDIPVHLPPLSERPAGVNGARDLFFGHGFVEIYINEKLDPAKRVRQYMDEAIRELIPPEIIYDFDINNWLNQNSYYDTLYDECIDGWCISYWLGKYELAHSLSYSCYAGKQKYTQKYYIASSYEEGGWEDIDLVLNVISGWTFVASSWKQMSIGTDCRWWVGYDNRQPYHGEFRYKGECSSPPPLEWDYVDQMVKYGMPKNCSEVCAGK